MNRDHPRVRGEKFSSSQLRYNLAGSPPRARGKGLIIQQRQIDSGITPACAGKRFPQNSFVRARRDHPRVRGEKLASSPKAVQTEGSPPRARGKVYQ